MQWGIRLLDTGTGTPVIGCSVRRLASPGRTEHLSVLGNEKQ